MVAQTVTYTCGSLNGEQTVADASGITTSSYDAAGGLIESNTPEGDIHYLFNLATGDHTETYTTYTDTVYGYDSQDRLQMVTVKKLNGSTLAAPLVTTYTYDAAGNKKTETLPNGEVSTYSYDDLNRLTGLTEMQQGTTLFSETIILNDDGTRKSATENQLQPDGSTVNTHTTWTYDADGRLTSEAVDVPGAAPATPQGLALTLTLPANYNLENGTADTLTWDGSNAYVSSGETETEAGNANYLGEVLLDPAAGVRFGGNGSDWVLVATDDSQDVDEQSYTLNNGTFTADNVVTYNREFNGTPTFTVAVAAGFGYANYYSYDLDNNRMQSVHVGPVGGANETITYVYNGDDELKSQTSSLSGLTTNIYDANGSLKTSTVGGVTTNYTYDARNKMVGYADGANTATYVYDNDSNRVAETADGVTTLYVTDTQNPTGYAQPIEQRSTATAAPGTTYILGDRVLGQVSSGGTVTYLLVDGHGSTQQTGNASGVVTAAFRYDAFGGNISFNANTASTAFLFGGDAIYDRGSGTYLHGNGERLTVGFRFLERDTYSGTAFDPSSLHRYVYAASDPISNSDPTGYDALSDEAFAEAGLYAATEVGTLQVLDTWVSTGFSAIGKAESSGILGVDVPGIDSGGNVGLVVNFIGSVYSGVRETFSSLQAFNDQVLHAAIDNALHPLDSNNTVEASWSDGLHHLMPKYLGGAEDGEVLLLSGAEHLELHRSIDSNLYNFFKGNGYEDIPTGTSARSARAWANFFNENPGTDIAAQAVSEETTIEELTGWGYDAAELLG